jgi:hypothetical protein
MSNNINPAPIAPADPWVVQEAGQAANVPPGAYLTEFQGVSDHVLQATGETRWRWAFRVKSGDHTGKVASALTDRKVSPTTLPGRLITGLLGRLVQPGENVQAAVDACKGTAYLVTVEPGPKGGKPGVRSANKPPVM